MGARFMPGTKNMSIGATLAIAGSLIIGDILPIPTGEYSTVAYGAVLIGGILFIIGLFQFVIDKRTSQKNRAITQVDPYVKAILQAMLSTSIADRELDETEVVAIAEIYKQIFGGEIPTSWIQDTAASMLSDDFDIGKTLEGQEVLIEDSMKPVILRAAYYVAAADGIIDDDEKTILLTIAGALKMEQSEIDNMFKELQQLAT
jgi:tellurite resistance protein